MSKYRCRDCGIEWESEVEQDECPTLSSYCGSKNVSLIDELEEEMIAIALILVIADDPLR